MIKIELTNDLLKQFAQITNDESVEKKETLVYGHVVIREGSTYVHFDGADSGMITPVSLGVCADDGDRVLVQISNHSATIVNNISNPPVTGAFSDRLNNDVKNVSADNVVIKDTLNAHAANIETLTADNATIRGKLEATEADIKNLTADNVSINGKLTAQDADIKNIKADNITINNKLTATEADINDIKADNVTINNTLTAHDADIVNIKASNVDINNKLTATEADIKNIKADNVTINNKLTATEADIETLTADNATINNKLTAQEADIEDLYAKKLNTKDAEITYANIDFSNITMATIGQFFSTSGIIKDVVVGDQTITGELVGVTIKGDLIEGNTIIAEKLVIKGDDGLYYKLNTDGVTTEAEQTDYNSLNGSVIRAQSVTADKIAVTDLVAFDATIAGFKMTDSSLYSGSKTSATNTTRGIYLGKDGQVAFGDANNFIKYYKDANGNYKLAISAESLSFATGKSIADAIDDIETKVENVKSVDSTVVEYQAGSSGTTPPTGNWTTGIPTVPSGQYLWTRTTIKYTDGTDTKSYGVSSKGDKGDKGDTGANGTNGTNGKDGKGIKSTTITYQAGSSGTSAPTGTWSSSVPTATASLPYIWTKTVITYTDNTTSTSYSVGATPEGIVVGGRNLLLNSEDLTKWTKESGVSVTKDSDGWYKVTDSSHSINRWGIYQDISKYEQNTDYILSVYVKYGNTKAAVSQGFNSFGQNIKILESGSDHMILTFNTGTNTSPIRIYLNIYPTTTNQYGYFKLPKLEKGNKATDWTPAPEDVDAGIAEAAKTASNFMSYDSTNGLMIGNKTGGSWSGSRAQITSSAFNILDSSGTQLASYGTESVIGDTSGRYVKVNSGGLNVYNGSTKIGQIGYGSVQDSSGNTVNNPYYDLGIRKSGSRIGEYSTAEGNNTTASGWCSHAEGYDSIASGSESHAEGYQTEASGAHSHAEGYWSKAQKRFSHAEGCVSIASGMYSHAEGNATKASGEASHSEGNDTKASGWCSHAEGLNTTASGSYSHAEGFNTTASGQYSHSSGDGTIAAGSNQTAIGQYNVSDTTSLFIVGNGYEDARSNAFKVDFSGNVTAAGDITNGSGVSVSSLYNTKQPFGSVATIGTPDLNTFYSGVILGAGFPNAPSAGWYLVVSGGTAGTTVQRAYDLWNGACYWRYCASGTWCGWQGNLNVVESIISPGTFSNMSSASANLTIHGNGLILRGAPSSKRYKHDITTEFDEELNPNRLYDVNIYQYKYNDDHLSEDDPRYQKNIPGFIAEDILEKYPIAAEYTIDDDGNKIAEDWSVRYIVPAMLKLIQDQNKRLEEQEEQIKKLESIIYSEGEINGRDI